MNKLKGLKPERVFYYFEQISQIPRGSGNTKAISDYIVTVANKLELEYRQDELNNVIVFKKASEGYEAAQSVMLQGHMDMVPEKESDSKHDFMKDPLDLIVENGYIHANGTTLGGDDGVAVAYILAILEDKKLKHPRLECVLTVDEETGMDGAVGIDLSDSTSKYLINLDSEEEGHLLASCAGGVRCDMMLLLRREKIKGRQLGIMIKGLVGGHSGTEIDKGRANANVLMGRILYQLGREIPYGLVTLEGGTKDNTITRQCVAEIIVDGEDAAAAELLLKSMERTLREEYSVTDPELKIAVSNSNVNKEAKAVHPMDQEKLITLLMMLPYGVQHMSTDLPGLVETSLNMGVIHLKENRFQVRMSLRSSVKSRKIALKDKLECICEYIGVEYTFCQDYPEWAFRKESALRDTAIAVYRDLFGKDLQVDSMHAGVECGILLNKKPELDIISMGPDILDIHTPQERLNIASTQRTYYFVLKLLEALN